MFDSEERKEMDAVIAEVLRGQGRILERLDALEKLICESKEEEKEDEAEDKKEMKSGGDQPLATNPALYSNQLEFDLPPAVF